MMGAKGDCEAPVPAASKALKKIQEYTGGNSYKPVSSWQKPITSFFEPVSSLKHLRIEKGKENERPKEILHTLEVNLKKKEDKKCQNSLKKQEITVVFPHPSQKAAGGLGENQEKAKKIRDKVSPLLPTLQNLLPQLKGKIIDINTKEHVQDYNVQGNITKMCFHCQKEFRSHGKMEAHLLKRHLTTCKICQVTNKLQEIYKAKQGNTPGSFLAGKLKRVTMKSEDSVRNSNKVTSLNNFSKSQSHCEYVGEARYVAHKKQKMDNTKDATSENATSASHGSTSGEGTPVLLGAFREFAIAERAKLRVMQPDLPFKKVRAMLQFAWGELGAGGRRDWEKWSRRNYQTALLRQSQESLECSSGGEDFV